MESTPRPKKLRPGEVAAAIGSTYKAIYHWVYKYHDRGVQPQAEQTGTWLEFSWGDVAALAITKYLVDLGMPAFGAFSVAMKIVETRWPRLFDVERPEWSMSPELMHMWFFLTREGNWGFGSFEKSEAQSVPPDSRAHIMLPVGAMVTDAFNALGEMGHEKPALDVSELKGGLALSEGQRVVAYRLRQLR